MDLLISSDHLGYLEHLLFVILKKEKRARHYWLMPVILATYEGELRSSTVRSQPGQTVCKPFLKNPSQKKAGGAGRVTQVVEGLLTKLSSVKA
jgi:hypothetical protein